MAKQNILVGSSSNDGSGDTIRNSFIKVNANFTELYTLTGGSSAALTELAQDYAAPMFTHAYNSGITFAYDDANNRLVATVSGQLPTQTGNSAKYLTTNGTALSWAGVGRLEFAGKTISLGNNGYITLASGAQLYDYGSGVGNGFGITDSQGSTYIGYDPDDALGALHMDSYNGKNIRIRTTTLPSTYKDWLFGADGNLTTPGNLRVDGGKIILHPYGNAYVESVDYGVNSANSALNIFGGPYQKIQLRAGFGTEAFWTFGTTGSLTFPDATVQTTAWTGLTPNGTKTSTATGTAGQTSYDSTYFYVCIATNTWRRVALGSTY